MMKKMLLLLLLLPFADALVSTGYRHTNDYYAVMFDGEGDAIVTADLSIRNTEDSPITSISLEFPREILIYDVVQEASGTTCARYRDEKTCESWSGGDCISYSVRQVCDYWQTFQSDYIRVNRSSLHEEVLSETSSLAIALPRQIEPQRTSRIVISYKVPGYARKLFTHSFDFETIIDNKASVIENVRVSIDVTPGLHLKGGRSDVEYRQDWSIGMEKMASSDALAYREYSSKVQNAGGYVKTASMLDAGESFHVKGTYSSSWLSLNWDKVLLALVVVGLIVYGMWFAVKPKKHEQPTHLHPVAEAILFPFVGSFTIVVMTLAGILVMKLLGQAFWYDVQIIINLLMILLIGALDMFVLALPAIIVGRRHGLGYGFLAFFATLTWLILLVILISVTMMILRPPVIYY